MFALIARYTKPAEEVDRLLDGHRAWIMKNMEAGKILLTARQVASPTITISPSDVAAVPRGQRITVRVSAPCDANSNLPDWFFGGKTLDSETTMVKE